MFDWLRKKKRATQDGTKVRITIEETLAFIGTIESFDIYTDVNGSDAKAVIKFEAGELLKSLKVGRA